MKNEAELLTVQAINNGQRLHNAAKETGRALSEGINSKKETLLSLKEKSGDMFEKYNAIKN